MAEHRDLADGEVALVSGSAAKPYEVKNTGGVYSCSCPAWRNQGKTIDVRTCKHIRGIRGAAAEAARVGSSAAAAPRPSAAKADAAPVLLAQKWQPSTDISGWWLSEKLDGVRAYWTGSEILSRLGNRFEAPSWFTAPLGDAPLDGELWVGRGKFQEAVGIVRRGDASELWREVKFLIFDCPTHGGEFEARIDWLRENFAGRAEHITIVEHVECRGFDHVREELERVEGLGGEGLMAREPRSAYVVGRSSTLVKIKTFLEDEAIVVGYTKGAGRHKGRVGSLEAELRSGVRFSVGTGLSDAQRDDPPPLGAIINVRFQELTRDGVPRFPSFVGVRVDVAWDGAKVTSAATSAAKRPSAVRSPAATISNGDSRRFELSDGSSSKFWQVAVSGKRVVVRYGRIGSDGTEKIKEHPSESAADSAASKLIGQKTKKGYVEVAG